MIKIIKGFFSFILLLVVAGLLFMYFHPTFGGTPSAAQQGFYQQLDNYREGRFVNAVEMDSNMNLSSLGSLIREWNSQREDRIPAEDLSVQPLDLEKIRQPEDSLTWFGHSNFLVSMDGQKILMDPMFSEMASPVSFIGTRRFTDDIFHLIDELPDIDAVFITHDHYDHLDYPSIAALKEKTDHFFVPLGVDAHLLEWGVKRDNITAMNWWEELEWNGLTIAAVPALHSSARSLFNRDATLWAGWVIIGQETSLYNSGDTGYGPHFRQIGQRYGPFDITLMEGGQYNERWPDSHMFPEESVQAHIDAMGDVMLLTHWGAFSLSLHGWSEPIERAWAEARDQQVSLIAPRIGETVNLKDLDLTVTPWWD